MSGHTGGRTPTISRGACSITAATAIVLDKFVVDNIELGEAL